MNLRRRACGLDGAVAALLETRGATRGQFSHDADNTPAFIKDQIKAGRSCSSPRNRIGSSTFDVIHRNDRSETSIHSIQGVGAGESRGDFSGGCGTWKWSELAGSSIYEISVIGDLELNTR